MVREVVAMNLYQHLFTALVVMILLWGIFQSWLTELTVPLVVIAVFVCLVWLTQSIIDFYHFLGRLT